MPLGLATKPSGDLASVTRAYGRLPLFFEANRGQTDSQVDFLARGQNYALFLTPKGAVLGLRFSSPKRENKFEPASLGMQLLGANHTAKAEGLDPASGKANYFHGSDPARWVRDVPTYGRVRYRSVYPGIDLIYYGKQGRVEHDWVISPGADPLSIRLHFEGARRLSIDKKGDLIAQTSAGEVRLERPIIYQEVNGERRRIAGGYKLNGSREVKFAVGRYDHQSSLVIDPTLVYSTFVGGSSAEYGQAIAVDSSGSAYITGYTYSPDFPVANAIRPGYVANAEVFITKFNSTGTALIYSTYLGGSGYDYGYGIAVDNAGSAYVTGQTSSSDFPLANPTQGSIGGGQDAFACKLNAGGNVLVYSTYLGGSSLEGGQGIAVDKNTGISYITGWTNSRDFPTLSPYQAGNFGQDAFVVKLSASGTRLYSSFLGGSNYDIGQAIAIDASGNIFVTGTTSSIDFPTTPGSLKRQLVGSSDAFVTKMSPSGSALLYSTYLGGTGEDHGMGIAVHSSGTAYVAGYTYSTDFPVTPGALQSLPGGDYDGFVARLSADGTALMYSTYLGGGKADQANAIAVEEPSGNVYLTGYTNSGNFPVTSGLQAAKNGNSCAFYLTANAGAVWNCSDAHLPATSVLAISPDSLNSLNIAIGTDRGVYLTNDGGVTWNATALSNNYISGLARSASSHNTLYAILHSSNVARSTDGGATWSSPLSLPANLYATILAVHPTNPALIYAATNSGVYRSSDSGSSWILSGLSNVQINSVIFDLNNPQVLYAATGSQGVYKSTDGGSTWNPINNGASPNSYVYALATHVSNSNVVYASYNGAVYKTTNGGGVWTQVCTNPAISGIVTMIAIAPSDANNLYFGTYQGTYHSADAGASCPADSTGIETVQVRVLAVDPFSPATAMIGTLVSLQDAFVAKLNSTGTSLIYSSYLGSPGSDQGNGIATDSAANSYVIGFASTNFPTTPGAFQVDYPSFASFTSTQQAFVAKISDATAGCSYSVNPGSLFVYSSGTTQSFGVVAPSGCAWTVGSLPSWITAGGSLSGVGLGGFSLNIGSNGAGATRTATLSIGGQPVLTITQAGNCSYSLSTTSITAATGGGTFIVNVNAANGCDWNVTGVPNWIAANSVAGSGNGSVSLVVSPNPNSTTRSTNILTIANRSISVSQSGTCTYSISPGSAVFPAAGGTGRIEVSTSAPGCSWSAFVSSGYPWLTVTGYSGTGLTQMLSGEVLYTVSPNPTAYQVQGTIAVAGLTFTVTVAGGSPLKFVAVNPCRVVDTRNANGPFGGPGLSGGGSRDFIFPDSACGIPATAAAYSINVTVVPRGSLGYLTVWPSGQPLPLASTLNSLDGRVKANAAILPAGANGGISVFATDTTDVILDINGYFVPTGASTLSFFPLPPCRVADTRWPTGTLGGPVLTGGQSRSFPVRSSACNVPATAQAYSVNFTAVPLGTLGYLTTYPTGAAIPLVSTLNAIGGQITANAAIVPAGANGEISVFATNTTHLVLDINGYFAPSGAGGLSLYNVIPCRVLDTRNPTGSPAFSGTKVVSVSGSSCDVSGAAQAYVFGATVVPSGLLGYLSLWPQGQQPLVSTMNAPDGAITSNMAIVPTANGSINAFATDFTHLILDLNAYFAP